MGDFLEVIQHLSVTHFRKCWDGVCSEILGTG